MELDTRRSSEVNGCCCGVYGVPERILVWGLLKMDGGNSDAAMDLDLEPANKRRGAFAFADYQ